MIYFRMYVQDYLAATSRISMLEHGAYMLLLAYYYADECPLPADKEDVYRIVRAITTVERKATDKVLDLFFELRADGYHQERADHEIEVSRIARENGSGGGRPKTGKVTGSGTGGITEQVTGSITGSITGSVTEVETGDGTQKVTGSGQPFSLSTNNSLSTSQPSNLSPNPVTPTAARPSSRKSRDSANLATAAVWNAYSTAYLERYRTEPVRNAKVNTHIARFVDRIGAAEAPAIAAFYLTHSKSSYTGSKHDAKFLEMDAEGLRTEWATGQRVTSTQAAQADRTQATGSVFQKLIDEADVVARQ